jgi:hypothetical protein
VFAGRRSGRYAAAGVGVAIVVGVLVLALGPRPSRASQPVSSTHRVVRDVLRAGGIGSVRFGASPTVARAAVDSLLGQDGRPYAVGHASCGIDHAIKWSDQWTASGEPALTLYFGRSAFVGYQFGDPPGSSVLRSPPGGWSLATARGLRVDNTLEQGRKLYGPAFAISTAQGGSWSVRVHRGLLRGYASGVPGHGTVTRVATIDAGDVGCPAVSP